jgi:hypothetical protein
MGWLKLKSDASAKPVWTKQFEEPGRRTEHLRSFKNCCDVLLSHHQDMDSAARRTACLCRKSLI